MSTSMDKSLAAAEAGRSLTRGQALALAEGDDAGRLTALAERLCVAGHGTRVTFSKKVFIPLTQLCRDVCHYCTFAHAPRAGEAALPFARGRARHRARGPGGRLQGGAVHARRSAGAALCGRAPGAG